MTATATSPRWRGRRPDDAVDVCSLIGRGLDYMHNAAPPDTGGKKRARDADYSLEDDDDTFLKLA